jgi:hypothetical protein
MRKRAADKAPGYDGMFGFGFLQSGYSATIRVDTKPQPLAPNNVSVAQ